METGIKLTTRQGLPGYRVTIRRKTKDGFKKIDKFFSFDRFGKAGALAEATKASKEFTTKYKIDTSIRDVFKNIGATNYKKAELDKEQSKDIVQLKKDVEEIKGLLKKIASK